MEGSHNDDTALLQVYGEYLLNGGTPEGFQGLTMDEVQIMFTVSEANKAKQIRSIAKILGGMFGGSERCQRNARW